MRRRSQGSRSAAHDSGPSRTFFGSGGFVYDVVLESSAEKEFNRLPRQLQLRIARVLFALKEDPRPSGVRKISGSTRGWRVRVGDYRIIYDIDDSGKRVLVFRKDGQLIAQITSPDFQAPQAVFGNTVSKKIYLVDQQRLFVLDLP